MTAFLVIKKKRIKGAIFHPFEYSVHEYEFENFQALMNSLNASLDTEYIIVEKSLTTNVKPRITYDITKEDNAGK